jgi:hypothetical protein
MSIHGKLGLVNILPTPLARLPSKIAQSSPFGPAGSYWWAVRREPAPIGRKIQFPTNAMGNSGADLIVPRCATNGP